MEKKQKIERDKLYTIIDIVRDQIFPWCSSFATCRKWIIADRQAKNYLKAVIIGEGRNRRFHIKGENIINFLKHVEDGSYTIFNAKN
jgi:hypothetical protein